MTLHTIIYEIDDETIRPLEYSAHTMFSEALGLPQLIRNAHPDEIEAVKDEFIQAANMVLAAVGTKQ